MIVVHKVSDVVQELRPTAVTIGKFDAIHLGHQELIKIAVQSAEEHMLVPTMVTFENHPANVLNADQVPAPIIGPKQKARLAEQLGIELMVSLPFDDQLATLSAEDFVTKVLVGGLGVKLVVVGEGFRFGDKALGDVALLRTMGAQLGFEVREVQHLEIEGKKVSSSWIRELLLAGEVEQAARLLGRFHATEGIVEHGLKIGREIGFPTANMSRDAEGFLPRDAVYAGWLHVDGERYMTALSVGINETFTAVPRLLEAHILDIRGLDLYDKMITCEYVAFIRPAAKFNGVEDLVAEINRDLDKIRQILG